MKGALSNARKVLIGELRLRVVNASPGPEEFQFAWQATGFAAVAANVHKKKGRLAGTLPWNGQGSLIAQDDSAFNIYLETTEVMFLNDVEELE